MLKSRRGSNIWVTFVVCSLLYCERFFSEYSAPGTPLWILRSCPLLKNYHHFEIPIHPGIISWRKNHLVDVPPLNHYLEYLLLLIILFIYIAYAAPLHFFPALYYLNTWKKANLTMGLVGLNPSRGGTGACGWKNVSPICASLLFLIPQATKPTWPAKLLSKIWHITNVNIFWIFYPNMWSAVL